MQADSLKVKVNITIKDSGFGIKSSLDLALTGRTI
jgi:hypothetical protein